MNETKQSRHVIPSVAETLLEHNVRLLAANVRLKARVHELEDLCAQQQEALQFYADPVSVKPGAYWIEEYPGGISYPEGEHIIRDVGEIAERACTAYAALAKAKP